MASSTPQIAVSEEDAVPRRCTPRPPQHCVKRLGIDPPKIGKASGNVLLQIGRTPIIQQHCVGLVTRRATCRRLRRGAAWGRARSALQELTWARLFEWRVAKRVSRPAPRREHRKGVGTPTRMPGARRVMGPALGKPDTQQKKSDSEAPRFTPPSPPLRASDQPRQTSLSACAVSLAGRWSAQLHRPHAPTPASRRLWRA